MREGNQRDDESDGRPRSRRGERARRGAAAGLAAVLVLVVVLAVPLATPVVDSARAAGPPDLSCAGESGGARYSAPSGLVVADDTAGPTDNEFVDDETIRVDEFAVSAPGSAFLRVELAAGDGCVSSVDATDHVVTVAGDNVTLAFEGAFDGVAFADRTVENGATFAYRASQSATMTLDNGTIPSGRTVDARDADTGSVLASATVSADGRLSFDLPVGIHRVELRAVDPGDADGDGGSRSGGSAATVTETTTRTTAQGGDESETVTDGTERTASETAATDDGTESESDTPESSSQQGLDPLLGPALVALSGLLLPFGLWIRRLRQRDKVG